MRQVVIRNCNRPQVTPIVAGYCDSFLCRLRGLTFRRELPQGWGLLLVQERDSRLDAAIHMLGMWLDLAVVWVNSERVVVDVRLARRWHLAYVPQRPARFVLETTIDHLPDFHIGEQVAFEESVL